MAIPQELTDALAKVDADTTQIATVVKNLRDQITTSMTPADVAAVKDTLSGIATRLEATAVDPSNPVPASAMPKFKKP